MLKEQMFNFLYVKVNLRDIIIRDEFLVCGMCPY